MGKLENYEGSIDLISGIRPKNNGNFPLVEAHDIQVDEQGTRLDDKLKEIEENPGDLNVVFRDNNEGDVEIIGSVINEDETTSSSIIIDSELNELSKNPVANSVLTNALADKLSRKGAVSDGGNVSLSLDTTSNKKCGVAVSYSQPNVDYTTTYGSRHITVKNNRLGPGLETSLELPSDSGTLSLKRKLLWNTPVDISGTDIPVCTLDNINLNGKTLEVEIADYEVNEPSGIDKEISSHCFRFTCQNGETVSFSYPDGMETASDYFIINHRVVGLTILGNVVKGFSQTRKVGVYLSDNSIVATWHNLKKVVKAIYEILE